MTTKPGNPSDFLPLRPQDFQVLTLLACNDLHGYGMVEAAEREFPRQPGLEIGSLYRIISRLLHDGLIREVPSPPESPEDRRVRRYYGATRFGLAVVRAEVGRLHSLLEAPATRRLREAKG